MKKKTFFFFEIKNRNWCFAIYSNFCILNIIITLLLTSFTHILHFFFFTSTHYWESIVDILFSALFISKMKQYFLRILSRFHVYQYFFNYQYFIVFKLCLIFLLLPLLYKCKLYSATFFCGFYSCYYSLFEPNYNWKGLKVMETNATLDNVFLYEIWNDKFD